MSVNKKQKVFHRPDWNTFGIPEELHSLIFQHFNAKDVLVASTVTWHWYHAIGKSKECMQKIRIELKEPGNCEMEVLENSSRNYQNINMVGPINNESLKFLDIFSSSIRCVKLMNQDTNDEEETFTPISLPFLENLNINFISNSILNLFLTTSKKIKVLAFEKVNTITRDNLISFLNAHASSLERLGLKNRAFDTIFEKNVNDILMLNLKIMCLFQTNRTDSGGTVIVNYHRPTRRRTHINRHLDNFLVTQAKSLQKISLDGFWYSGTIQTVFNVLPQLNEISICRCVDHERLKISCHPNENIKQINFLKFMRCKRQTWWSDHKYLEMMNILKEAPYLERLHVHEVPAGIIEYAGTYFNKLTDLTYDLGPEKSKNTDYTTQDMLASYEKMKPSRPDSMYKFYHKHHQI